MVLGVVLNQSPLRARIGCWADGELGLEEYARGLSLGFVLRRGFGAAAAGGGAEDGFHGGGYVLCAIGFLAFKNYALLMGRITNIKI